MLVQKKIVLLIWLIILLIPKAVEAHGESEPALLNINHQPAKVYPVPSKSVSDFNLPEDLASENYLVDEELEFEINTDTLLTTNQAGKTSQFAWDFGDGGKGSGLESSHIYTKPGSYVLVIYAQSGENPTPQILQSVMLHVLPNKDYKLPQAVIKVNGRGSKDPLVDILKFNFKNELELDGSDSLKGSADTTSFFWDLGDGKSFNGLKTKYKYSEDNYAVFPVLRVKDQNGFISDAYVQITNSGEEIPLNIPSFESYTKYLLYLVILTGGVLIIVIYFRFKKR